VVLRSQRLPSADLSPCCRSDSDFEQSGPSDRVQRRTSGRVRRAVGTAADPTLQFVPQLETDRWTAEHVAALTSIVNEQVRARRLTGWSIIDQRVGREGCENRWFATLEMAEAKCTLRSPPKYLDPR
jgi:hypothetical protein